MIKGAHLIIYSSDPAGLRVFIKDKLGLNATDKGGGWLIFDLPKADLCCQPPDDDMIPNSGTSPILFYCDNIEQTVRELKEKGVEFIGTTEDHGHGFSTFLKAPGNLRIQLYQAK